MRQFLFPLLLIASILPPAGCRSINPSIELLESELRQFEDQLYVLDHELSVRDAQLQSCRKHNEVLRRELLQTQKTPPTGGRAASGTPDIVPQEPARRSCRHPSPAAPRPAPSPSDELPADPPPPADVPSDSATKSLESMTNAPLPLNLKVARIRLNPRLTGGYDQDKQLGDDGVLVVVEPQDTHGQYLPAPGQLSVVLTDPTRPGLAGRIARWDFDETESVALLRKSLFGKGFHLRLPWPNRTPRVPRLQLHVRYTTADGRQLLDRRFIDIDLPATGAESTLAPTTVQNDVVPGQLASPPLGPQPRDSTLRQADRSSQESNSLTPAWQPYR